MRKLTDLRAGATFAAGISAAYRSVTVCGRVTEGLASQTRALAARRAQGSIPEVTRSQSEEAYLRIRDRIVCLDMPPGSVVEEGRLRDELEIGRTPIREALQRLAWENLVRSVPHRGSCRPRGPRGEAGRRARHGHRPGGDRRPPRAS